MYLYTVIVFIFFLGWTSFFETAKSNLRFNKFFPNIFIRANFFLFAASLVGLPPLFGFFTKFIIFLNLLLLQKYIFFIFFLIFNGFLMVFYLNQFRYVQSNFKKNFFFLKKNKTNTFIIMFIIVSQFINLFALIFLPFLIKFFIIS